jgi:hypothetical protein
MSRISEVSASSASSPLGGMQGQKVFRLQTGAHAGRAVVLYRPSANALALRWADAPHDDWSEPLAIASDAADSSFAAFMHPDGQISVAYTKLSTLELVYYRLAFDGDDWQPQTQRTIYNADANYDPSLEYDLVHDRIWVAWTRYVSASGLYFVQNKRSLDSGDTWGSGPGDPGTALTSGSSGCRAHLVRRQDFMHCVYQDGGTKYAHRSFYINSALWLDEEIILSGSGLGDAFYAAASATGRLGVVMADGASLKYREYNGSEWGPVINVADLTPINPSVLFIMDTPVALWGEESGSGFRIWKQAPKSGSVFASPLPLFGARAPFDHVLLYSSAAANAFADVTSAAADVSAGDLVHPETGALATNVDDAVYIGHNQPFDLASIVLSTPGAGGAVQWSYWNGTLWQPFVPASGPCHFDTSPARVRFAADGYVTPADWQAGVVNSRSAYWIRARVVTAFTVAPVGSQIIAADVMNDVQPGSTT